MEIFAERSRLNLLPHDETGRRVYPLATVYVCLFVHF